jgi:hypothetical protein
MMNFLFSFRKTSAQVDILTIVKQSLLLVIIYDFGLITEMNRFLCFSLSPTRKTRGKTIGGCCCWWRTTNKKAFISHAQDFLSFVLFPFFSPSKEKKQNHTQPVR